ncbi:MAG: hypothetical protein MJZ19_04890 [Paludibacteraceae bacterium]|nr:hypothetical protein [Paludibacteraceae bacterium]
MINEELEKIFVVWKNKLKENGDGEFFTKDGILRQNNKSDEQIEQEWFSSSKRILILLKDQNQYGELKWDEDIRDWLKDTETDNSRVLEQKQKNRNLEIQFTKRIAFLLWGLSKMDEGCKWWCNEVVMHIDEVKKFFNTQPFALVECKKVPGGGFLNDRTLKKHLQRYGALLKNEIDILNPNIVVCTSPYIYDFVVSSFPKESIFTIDGHNSIRISKDGQKETIILCSYHPSVRKSDEYFYEGVMDHYREYIQRFTEK